MSSGYSIRPVEEGDLPVLLSILNESIETSPANFHWQTRPLSELQDEWQQANGKYPWFALIESASEEAVGFAKAGPFRGKHAYTWTVEVTIYLNVSACGTGQGTLLYSALLDELALRGYHLAIGAITLPNVASESLHEKLGFHLLGVLPEVGWKMDAWHDVAMWGKKLGDGPALQIS